VSKSLVILGVTLRRFVNNLQHFEGSYSLYPEGPAMQETRGNVRNWANRQRKAIKKTRFSGNSTQI